MEKEKLPVEKDVDLELEYKIYRVYDILKKKIKLILISLVILLLIFLGYYYKKELDSQEKIKASVELTKISQLIADNKLSEAEKEINNFEKNYKDTDYYKVVLAYKILLKKENNLEDVESGKKILNLLETDISSGFKEYLAYINYKNGDLKTSKDYLKSINSKDYNYLSSQILYAFILKKEGSYEEAKKIFEMVKNNQNYRYLSLLAKESL